MKYIVFGGGFIGSSLTRKLRHNNHYVITIDRNPPRHSDHIGLCEHYIWKDISNLDNFPDQYGIDGVFQTCGMMPNGSNNDELFANNYNINKSVVKFCTKHGIKNIFFASSVWASNPINSYGSEKLSSESMYTEFARDSGFKVKIGRIGNIYGTFSNRGLIYDMCKNVFGAESEICIYGNSMATRSFLHIDDCIDGILKVMNAGGSEPVFIGSDEMYTIKSITQRIIEVSGKDLVIKSSTEFQENSYACENSVLRSLGWNQRIMIEDGLRQVYSEIEQSIKHAI
jgi:GDP-D-mannose 3',5'-epimerase